MIVASELPTSARLDWADLDLYRFFAFVFASPSRERFDTLAQPAVKDALAELWQRLCCKGDFPHFAWFESYAEYEAAYIALFDVGIPEPPVPLFESAHDKTKPAQEIALENTWFHDALGLKWDSRCAVPDYLITQLEFLAAVHYTFENSQDSATRRSLGKLEADFLSRHLLNWIFAAGSKLNGASPSTFGPLMILLTAFLQNRRAEVSAGLSTLHRPSRWTRP